MAVINNPFYTPDGVRSGNNISVTGNVSATGDVIAAYLLGDGSNITNINAANLVGAYDNANVVNLMANFGSNTIVTTGNIDAGFFNGNGNGLTGLVWSNITGANANVAAYLGGGTVTDIAVSNSVVAANAVIADQFINPDGIVISGNTITTTSGLLTINSATSGPFTGNVKIDGNLEVTGNLTYIDANTTVTSNLLYIAAVNVDQANATNATGAGIAVGDVASGNTIASWTYSNAANAWVSNINISSAGNVVATANVNAAAASVAGRITSNQTVANTANIGDATITTLYGTTVSVLGTITGASLVGNGSGITYIDANVIQGNASSNLVAGIVSAIGNLDSGGNVNANGNANIGGDVNSGGNANVAGDVIAGNSLVVTLDATIGGNLVASGNIDGNNVNASNVISAAGNIETTSGIVAAGNIRTNGGIFALGNINTSSNVNAASFNATTSFVGPSVVGTTIVTAPSILGTTITANTLVTSASIVGNTIVTAPSVFGNTVSADTMDADTFTATANVTAPTFNYGNLDNATSNTRITSYRVTVVTGNAGTLTLPAGIRATDFNWVAESQDDDSAAMSKGFLVANTDSVSISSYGFSNIGVAVFSQPAVSGNIAGIEFTFANTTVDYDAVLTTVQYKTL